uniref:Uncharacterized protein n=1 Tax=Mycena chlorophos TaxID=658473 RepID=A0ABQ0M1P0_MYCCL|nr:predicted protein [Mycena chlorophos]
MQNVRRDDSEDYTGATSAAVPRINCHSCRDSGRIVSAALLDTSGPERRAWTANNNSGKTIGAEKTVSSSLGT